MVGTSRHSLSPVRRPSNYWLPKELHLWSVGRNEAAWRCARASNVRGMASLSSSSDSYNACLKRHWASRVLPVDVILDFLFRVPMEQYTMDRGVVHACHAGGVVHFLEGWTHHEVGAIDVDRIDVVWDAAMKHGLKPVWSNGTLAKTVFRKIRFFFPVYFPFSSV